MARHALPAVPTVLLVDSIPGDRATYAEYLRSCGFHPLEIDDPAEALRSAKDADVIVAGVRVESSVHGFEFVRRLRQNDETCDIPVIALTASASESDRQQAFKAGADHFLTKPCLPEELVKEIRALLSRGFSEHGAREWRMLWTARPNILITGAPAATDQLLAMMTPHFNRPISWQTGSMLQQGYEGAHTLVIRHVDRLSVKQQKDMMTWLEHETVRPVRIVSTTTVPLFQRLADDLFLDRLYYRLNTVMLDAPPLTDRAHEAHAAKIG